MSAGDQIPIHDDFLIQVFRTSILDVLDDGFPPCDSSTLEDLSRNQELGRMADRKDGFAALDKLFHEGHDLIEGSQPVGRIASGNQKSIEIRDFDIFDLPIDND